MYMWWEEGGGGGGGEGMKPRSQPRLAPGRRSQPGDDLRRDIVKAHVPSPGLRPGAGYRPATVPEGTPS